MINHQVVSDFASLFRGYPDAYGTYAHVDLGMKRGKQKPRQWSKKQPITPAVIANHLEGKEPLGVYPLNENEQVQFAAIDIDVYPLDFEQISSQLIARSIPMLVCNSKSNGAHVYVFFSEAACPSRVVAALQKIASMLGFPTAEIFPKQTRRTPGQLGNYINLPFFGSKKLSFACWNGDKTLGLEEFLVLAKQSKTTIEILEGALPEEGLEVASCSEYRQTNENVEGRNAYLFKLGLELKKSGLSDAIIAEALKEKNRNGSVNDHPNFLSDGPLPESEVDKIIHSLKQMLAHDDQDKISNLVASINSTHAHIMIAGKAKIINVGVDPSNGWETYDFSAPSDFRSRYANQKITIGGKLRTAADVWLQHPQRRSYNGIIFSPACQETEQFNLFQGFPVEPKAGDCSLYLEHIHKNICSHDDGLYQYVISWMADAIQNPAKRPGIALAIRGKQGVGKGVFVNNFARLFGPHFIQVTQSSHLVGNFNAHLRDKLLVFADEAFWAGDKRAEGALKGLITEDQLAIEMKGVDVQSSRNFARIIMSSNNEWIVPASVDQRRFVVIEASSARIQDSEYFRAIADEMDTGGREALMHVLVNWDLSGINLRKIPRTKALIEQQLRSLGTVGQWLYSCLEFGGLEEPEAGGGTYLREWPDKYETKEMFNAYVGFCRRLGLAHPEKPTMFGKILFELMPSMAKRREGNKTRRSVYLLPDLERARAEFEQTNKLHSIDWGKSEDLI